MRDKTVIEEQLCRYCGKKIFVLDKKDNPHLRKEQLKNYQAEGIIIIAKNKEIKCPHCGNKIATN